VGDNRTHDTGMYNKQDFFMLRVCGDIFPCLADPQIKGPEPFCSIRLVVNSSPKPISFRRSSACRGISSLSDNNSANAAQR
jgi:hypothetical protein